MAALPAKLPSLFSSMTEENSPDAINMVPTFVSEVQRLRDVQFDSITSNGRKIYEFRMEWLAHSEEDLREWERIKTLPIKGPLECDYCHQLTDYEKMVQFGLCDHNMCCRCLTAAGTRPIFDGSPSCCHPDCKIRTSASSSCSSLNATASQHFVIHLRIMIFSLENGGVVRSHRTSEVSSSLTLAELRQRLLLHVPDLEYCKLFYTTENKFNRKDLMEISSEEMGRQRLERLAGDEEMLTVVVARPGVALLP